MIRGDRAMRHLSVYNIWREPIAGFAHRQEKRSLTPFSSSLNFLFSKPFQLGEEISFPSLHW